MNKLPDQGAYGSGQCRIERIGQGNPYPAGRGARAWRKLQSYWPDMQSEMSEAVREGRQVLLVQCDEAEVVAAVASGVDVGSEFGQAPQAAPYAPGRAFFQHEFARSSNSSICTCLSGSVFLGRGAGSSRTRSCVWAMQSALTGHAAQAGRLRVQTSAPRSIMPCV